MLCECSNRLNGCITSDSFVLSCAMSIVTNPVVFCIAQRKLICKKNLIEVQGLLTCSSSVERVACNSFCSVVRFICFNYYCCVVIA